VTETLAVPADELVSLSSALPFLVDPELLMVPKVELK